MKIKAIALLLIMSACAHRFPAADSFWKFENSDAKEVQVEYLKNDMIKCEEILNSTFKVVPEKMTIITYGSSDSFIAGLQEKLNFSKKNAERYRNGGAPKPARGYFLVPPQMKGRSFCHEIVHKYVEMKIPEHKIAQMKWFDEGAAEYFSKKIFEYNVEPDELFVKNHFSELVPLERLITRDEWGKLFDGLETRKLAYMQARSMFAYFMNKYGIEKYFELIARMNQDADVIDAFYEITGENLQGFYENWKKSLVSKEY